MGNWADGKTLSNKSWGLRKENRYFLWFPIMGLLLAMLPLETCSLLDVYHS